jgi:hypothetical protein
MTAFITGFMIGLATGPIVFLMLAATWMAVSRIRDDWPSGDGGA